MLLSLRLHASIALISFAFFTSATHAEKLRITSTPPGAKVEINGVAVGTTPFEKDYPSGYFHKTKTARLTPGPSPGGSLEFRWLLDQRNRPGRRPRGMDFAKRQKLRELFFFLK
jgi:hypothetical protein